MEAFLACEHLEEDNFQLISFKMKTVIQVISIQKTTIGKLVKSTILLADNWKAAKTSKSRITRSWKSGSSILEKMEAGFSKWLYLDPIDSLKPITLVWSTKSWMTKRPMKWHVSSKYFFTTFFLPMQKYLMFQAIHYTWSIVMQRASAVLLFKFWPIHICWSS